ncbi:MAG: DUF1772 domain-containing protein [Mesorhizobium sp.]|nr:DUF1772 domain-containing protein [Mesorhizobium sp.]
MLARYALQFVDIIIIALLAGTVFGVWRGYDPAGYSPAAFLEIHQGAVRGLNTLLPAMGAAALLLTGWLAWGAKGTLLPFRLYLVAMVAMVAAGLVTRFGNQPINATVMTWTADAIPSGWEELRDTWWRWHMIRVGATIAALALLVAAVMSDLSERSVAG